MRRGKKLGISAAVAAGSAALAYGGFAASKWLRYGRPFTDKPTPNAASRFLPDFEVRERHEIDVAAPAHVTWDVAYHLDLRGSWLVQSILNTRDVVMRSREKGQARAEFLEEVLALGWGVLAEVPGRELVLGAVTRPWEADVRFESVLPHDFASFHAPGYAKIVWTIEVDPLSPSSSLFRTETRVATTDAPSRARFRRYWSLVSPGILLIRREALRLVKAEAERRNRKELFMFGRKSTFTGFLLTFGAGILTGAALALLYTPITGKKMQRKVADITGKVIDKVDDIQDKVRKVANA